MQDVRHLRSSNKVVGLEGLRGTFLTARGQNEHIKCVHFVSRRSEKSPQVPLVPAVEAMQDACQDKEVGGEMRVVRCLAGTTSIPSREKNQEEDFSYTAGAQGTPHNTANPAKVALQDACQDKN